MILWLATALALAGTCELEAEAQASFQEVQVRAEGVMVVLELWADGAPQGWLQSSLDQLEQRGLPATVVASPDLMVAADFPLSPLVRESHDHALALRFDLPPRQEPGPDGLSPTQLRQAAREVRKVLGQRIRTVAAPSPGRLPEALLRKAGYRQILDLDGPSTAEVRGAVQYEDQLGIGVVVPAGPYVGPCGPDPKVGPFTPRAADRAGRALGQAAGTQGVAALRVALDGARGVDTDAEVLGRWLDEVVLPSGALVVAPAEVWRASNRAQRGETIDRGAPAGRLVTLDELHLAADFLADVHAVPRALPGGLNPTEAWLGMATWLADRSEGEVVRLGELGGPASSANTVLDGPVQLPEEAVRETARAILAGLPDRVPSALPVDGQLLTAGELLLLFASTLRGDDPPTTRPVAVPEPHEDGLGWGRATLP